MDGQQRHSCNHWQRGDAAPGAERRAQPPNAPARQAASAQAAEAIAQAITAMNARLNLPKGLADMGVTPDCFDKVIAGAMADHCHKTNPRIATPDEYREMLSASM